MAHTLIQWTKTARNGLAKLPMKVRRGLLEKANELLQADDPASVNKPLTGPLQGYYRICYSRYRAIYTVEQEARPGGQVFHKILVRFVAAGIRKEGDKNDVYRLAQKLIRLGVIETKSDPPKRPPKE